MDSAELTELKRSLRQLLVSEGTGSAITAFKKALPENSPKFNAVFQLETRLNMANRDKIRGVLSQEQLELTYNRLSADLIDLIDQLEPGDFSPAAVTSKKNGSILYKIPHTMQVERETRCIVRLAFDEDVVIQNIELTGAVLQAVRVSEVMEVDLVDPNELPAFAIRPVNSAEQFLETGDFTEWVFHVTPLRTGQYPLALRVSVIEVIAGKDRKKEIVLEETIQVVAEPEEDGYTDSATFQNAGYTFSYTTMPDAPPGTSASTLRKLSSALLVLLIIGAGAWALGFRQELAWLLTQREDTKAGYEQYLHKFPDGRHREQAMKKIDHLDWLETVRSSTDSSLLRHYLLLHPDGVYQQDARRKLDSLSRLIPVQDSILIHLMRKIPVPDTLLPDTAFPDVLKSVSDNRKTKASPPVKKERPKPAPSPAPPPVKVPEKATTTVPIQPGPAKPDTPATNSPVTPQPKPSRRSGFELVDVPGGRFTMGDAKGDKDECPHELTLHSFKIGKYEVTQADWVEIMGNNPAFYKGCDECPVENVSWNDIQEFLQKAGAKRGVHYRLPAEAEWEYAARGGQQTQGLAYAGSNRAGAVAWNHGNTERPNRVGRKKANELGLFDMSGNVWEWCSDLYQPYPGCKGTASAERNLRGGGWRNYDTYCRVSNRNKENPGKRDYLNGFRLASD